MATVIELYNKKGELFIFRIYEVTVVGGDNEFRIHCNQWEEEEYLTETSLENCFIEIINTLGDFYYE